MLHESMDPARGRAYERLRKQVGLVLAVAVALVVLIDIVQWANDAIKAPKPELNAYRPGIGKRIFQGAEFQPEPAERAAYAIGCLSLPLVLMGALAIHQRLRMPKWLLPGASLLGVGVFLALLVFILRNAPQDGKIIWYWDKRAAPRGAIATLLLLAAIQWLPRRAEGRVAKWLFDGVMVLVCVLLASYQLASGQSNVYSTVHLEPIVYPLVQVLHGRTLLVDADSLYGLYPHFLEPVFRMIGLSVANFSAVMALLFLVTLLCIFRYLRMTLSGRFTTLIAFVGSLFSPFIFLNSSYAYYQYHPLRTLFPALVIWLSARYGKRPTAARLAWLSIAGGAALLWNLDSGIAAFGAVLTFVFCRELAERDAWSARLARACVRTLAALGISALTIGLAFAGLWARSGQFPQLANLAKYHSIFYREGFLMAPMHPLGRWWFVVAIYTVALAWGVAMLLSGRRRRRAPQLLMLAVLGAGLFAYYQGRSVAPNLYGPIWPAILLLGVFIDMHARRRRTIVWSKFTWPQFALNVSRSAYATTAVFALCLLVGIAIRRNGAIVYSHPLNQYRAAYSAFCEEWRGRADFVKQSIGEQHAGEPLLVISSRDHLWHMCLKCPSVLSGGGFNHLFYQREIDQICDMIEAGAVKHIVWDEAFLKPRMPEIICGYMSPAEHRRLLRLIGQHYTRAGKHRSPAGHLALVYTAKDPAENAQALPQPALDFVTARD